MKNVAIIGAGIGGLTAGNLLVKKGHRVTIFESHSAPGGYTAGFWKKGFYFESGTLAYESSGVMNKTLEDIGVADQVRRLAAMGVSDFCGAPFGSGDEIRASLRAELETYRLWARPRTTSPSPAAIRNTE